MSIYESFWTSCTEGKIEEIKKIIDMYVFEKHDILRQTSNNQNALMIAGWHGHLEIIKFLVEKYNLKKEDIMLTDNTGDNILIKASYMGHYEIVLYIIDTFNLQKHDIMINNKAKNNALVIAIKQGYYDIIKLLINKSNLRTGELDIDIYYMSQKSDIQILLKPYCEKKCTSCDHTLNNTYYVITKYDILYCIDCYISSKTSTTQSY